MLGKVGRQKAKLPDPDFMREGYAEGIERSI